VLLLENTTSHNFNRTLTTKMQIRENVTLHVLQSNAKILTKHRYSSFELLQVGDFIFEFLKMKLTLSVGIEINELQKLPLKIPSAFLMPIPSLKGISSTPIYSLVAYQYTNTLLLFVTIEDEMVMIGCFTCVGKVISFYFLHRLPLFPVKFLEPFFKTQSSFYQLKILWKNLHQKLDLDFLDNDNKCMTMTNHVEDYSHYTENICEIVENYFAYLNCTNHNTCEWMHGWDASRGNAAWETSESLSLTGLNYISQILPFATYNVDCTFQILFPKIRYFDANIHAYLLPFTLEVWICVMVLIAVVSCWLVLIAKFRLEHVLFWEFSVVSEQDGNIVSKSRLSLKAIMIIWIFSAIILRNFYNSSLYSFMATEKVPNDFPKSMGQLLKRNDFEFIMPYSFYNSLKKIRSISTVPKGYKKLYLNIINKAFQIGSGMNLWNNIRAVETISNGMPVEVFQYRQIESSRFVQLKKTFSRFAILCEEDCESEHNLGFFGQKILHQVRPIQQSFHTTSKLWRVENPNFATFRLSNFLGSFSQSGLYELIMKRQNNLLKYLIVRDIMGYKTRGMGNGSLFSYFFLGRFNSEFGKAETPTTTTALFGNFILTGSFLLVALMVMLFEMRSNFQH